MAGMLPGLERREAMMAQRSWRQLVRGYRDSARGADHDTR